MAHLEGFNFFFPATTKSHKSCMKQALMEIIPFENVFFSAQMEKALMSEAARGHGAH